MSSAAIAKFTTNTTPNSKLSGTIGCESLWAQGQVHAIKLLSKDRNCAVRGNKKQLVNSFSARAARIAAAYARFYLEEEPGCQPKLKGRFYWMGLAAFASKQVKCGLDFIDSASSIFVSIKKHSLNRNNDGLEAPLKIGKNYLGQGNFWLFQDIYVWHWFYANYPDQFEGCAPERNTETYPPECKNTVNSLPWSEETLDAINHLKLTEYITSGFANIAKFEASDDAQEKNSAKYSSLLNIADHEQRKILQPLIYDNLPFQQVLKVQQMMEAIPWLPQRMAAFSTACDTGESELKIQMDDGDLYNENDRMRFIVKIANQYDRLMKIQNAYMEEEIAAISKWGNSI